MQQDELDATEPQSVPPKRRRPRWRLVAAIAVVAGLIAVAFVVPIPVFFAYLPGPVRDVEDLVNVRGVSTYSSEGSLYLTTVSVDTEVTFAEWLTAVIDPTEDVVSRESVTGGGSLDDLQRLQREEMAESKQSAEVVALGAIGIASPKGDGARIAGVVPDSPAAGLLRQGDVVVDIDGTEISTSCDVGRVVGAQEPGDDVRITLLRDGAEETVTLTTTENPSSPGRSFLGVAMAPNYEFDSGMDIDFETGRIAGPSAGLMFSLALYDRLTPDDLTGGREIAGTGTISCDGSVGPIGGVKQKVAGAEDRGADIFLAPQANATDARAAAGDIEIVAIDTFSDALEYLQNLE